MPMLTETGLITKVVDDIAWVNTRSKLACSSCQVSSTCGNGILEQYLSGKIFISQVPNELNAEVGDEVTIAIPKSSVTKAALLIYFIPIFALFVGAMLGHFFWKTELASIISGGVGLILALLLIAINNHKFSGREQFVPKMVSKKNMGFDPEAFQSIDVKEL